MTQWNEEAIKEAMGKVTSRAATDKEFRELCFTDARAAVKEATGFELPENFNLRFVDNKNAHLTFVLPDKKKDGELSDDDLDEVSGGFVITAGIVAATIGAAGAIGAASIGAGATGAKIISDQSSNK